MTDSISFNLNFHKFNRSAVHSFSAGLHVIYGESGSGKSLTLKALLGMLPQNLTKTLDLDSDFTLVRGKDISIVPLGIPILFGPGAIATIIVLNHNHTKDIIKQI